METKEMEDWRLAELVRDNNSEEALLELCARHSGIYMNTVSRHSTPMTQTQKDDLINEKEYNIYMAAKKYDKNKSKFSTHLAALTLYKCLGQKTKNKNNNTINSDDIIFWCKDSGETPEEKCLSNEINNEFESLISGITDEREKKIFEERYFSNEENFKLKPWSAVAKTVDMSIQGCIDIHDKVIKRLRKRIY